MNTIALSLQKGGVGKTSLAVSLAAELASLTGSVLLIDADPQASATSWIGAGTIAVELADVLAETAPLLHAITQTRLTGLDLLPSAGLGGALRAYSEGRGKDDPLCLRRLVKLAAAHGYQYTIIDLSPGWGAIERAAALAADQIITPVLGDSFAIDGLQIFSENLVTLRQRFETDRPAYNRIIVNAVDGRIKQHAETLAAIHATAAGLHIYRVPVDPAFRLAQRNHRFVQEVATLKAETRDAFRAIAKDIQTGGT
ncbi:MAG: ParA family protein [Prevotella sp.]|nr:ParA family protein [Prevotella sp.]